MGRTLLGVYGPRKGDVVLDPEETIDRLVAQVQNAPNATTGAIDSSSLLVLLRQAVSKTAELRRAFFRALTEQGYEMAEIGELLEPPITRERVRQILDA